MPRYSTKETVGLDVLVVGDHASAFFAAALLKHKTRLRVVHCPGTSADADDRLVLINPRLFDLHPLLGSLKQTLPLTPLHGLDFLADHSQTRIEHRAKSPMIFSCPYGDVRQGMAQIAEQEGVENLGPLPLRIHRVDEEGLELELGKHAMKPASLILAGEVSAEHKRMLGVPDAWGAELVHCFSYARCKAGRHLLASGKMLMPMSLDLCGQLCWGWLIPGDGEFQITVEQPAEKTTPTSGRALLLHWARVLQGHGVLAPKFEVPPQAIRSMSLPLAGALAHEGVGNRTLLIGPAGGFYSACGEELFPCCWSALFAADVMKKALKERHLQDALNPYRQKWRTTLGDYLRGPHQNLRFLLPMVYRNPAMASRLAEAILLSKSVVR